MAAAPQRLGPPPLDDDEDDIEVTRESVARERRAERTAAQAAERAGKTRRSWYTSTAAADRFQQAVDDIHHATRVPKHEVVAALLDAAADQADRVGKRLAREADRKASHT